LRGRFLLIRIRIIAVVALVPVHISASQVKPLEFSCGPSSPADYGDGIVLVDFVTFIVVILAAPSDPEMQIIIRTIVVYRDVWVSASDLRLLTHHLGGQILRKNSIVNMRWFRADGRGRRWVLRLVYQTLDCHKSVFRHPLSVALW
jgi:hypothetical protein